MFRTRGTFTPVVSRSFVVAIICDLARPRKSGMSACPFTKDMHLNA